MIAILVTARVKPEKMDEFIKASLGDAMGSVGTEENCFRFDVLRDASDPNKAYFYEVYTDDDARVVHREQPHFLKWRDTVVDLLDGPYDIIEMESVFPTDGGWRAQKPCLLEE